MITQAELDKLNADWIAADKRAKATPEAIAAARAWSEYQIARAIYDAQELSK